MALSKYVPLPYASFKAIVLAKVVFYFSGYDYIYPLLDYAHHHSTIINFAHGLFLLARFSLYGFISA
jgi:hypothetical protein